MTTVAAWPIAALRCAEHLGVARELLLKRAGISARLLEDGHARIPTDAYMAILKEAAAASRSPSFGVELARAVDAPTFGIVGCIVASCSTLGAAFTSMARYTRLLSDELSVDLQVRGNVARVVYGMDARLPAPAFFEMALTHLARTARRGTRGAFVATALSFRHRPAAGERRTIPGIPTAWGASEDALVCERKALDLPLRGSNPTQLHYLEAYATRLLAELPARDDLVHQARAAIRSTLSDGRMSIEAIAERIGVGPRTLQRRLRERDLSFRELVDDIRRECALLQLADPTVRSGDVAHALGFGSPSAFHHAFRRWTGHAPRE